MGLLKSRTTPPRPIGVVMMIALIASVSLSSTSLAQEVTLKSTVANWSIYCLKNVSEIKPQDCSLVTAAVGESDPNVWVRVGLTQSSPQEMEMTIRTPRLEHLKKGISIRTEDGQLGRAFIDTCDGSSCQTTVAVEPRMLRGLLAAATVTFEYQTSDEEGAALAVNTQQFAEALNEFNSTIFPAAMVAQSGGTSKPWIFTVELRTNPNTDPSTDAWGDRYKNWRRSRIAKDGRRFFSC